MDSFLQSVAVAVSFTSDIGDRGIRLLVIVCYFRSRTANCAREQWGNHVLGSTGLDRYCNNPLGSCVAKMDQETELQRHPNGKSSGLVLCSGFLLFGNRGRKC